MSSTTIIIIVAVAVIWAILFVVFMKFNKKRPQMGSLSVSLCLLRNF